MDCERDCKTTPARRAWRSRRLPLTATAVTASVLLGGASPAFAVTYTFTQLGSTSTSSTSAKASTDAVVQAETAKAPDTSTSDSLNSATLDGAQVTIEAAKMSDSESGSLAVSADSKVSDSQDASKSDSESGMSSEGDSSGKSGGESGNGSESGDGKSSNGKDGTKAKAAELSVQVKNNDNKTVSFTFYNNLGQQSSITDIYFTGTGGLLTVPGKVADQSEGVSFSLGADPKNLPGGEKYDFFATVGADSNAPIMSNGVNKPNEYVTWTFALANGMTYDDVLGAMNSGKLQIGLNVQGYANGTGSFVNSTAAVPLPASVWLMAGALGSLAFMSRRNKAARQS